MLSDFMNKEVFAIEKLKSLGVIFKKVPEEIIVEANKNVKSVIDNYAVDDISTRVRNSYFTFLDKRKSFSDFDISNYLNSRKI